jgi:uncharacterized protein (DUF111 family)
MSAYETDTVTRLETNLDDCTAEMLGAVMDRLFAAGALDVWFTPIHMKKNRPGVMLSVLGEESATTTLADIIFAETSAFGLRIEKITRLKLVRRFETVSTRYGNVTVKIGLKGDRVLQIAPEFESCRALMEKSGASLREIYTAALLAFENRK